MNTIKRIAISIGDPNGIGPEIALKGAAHYLGDGAIQPVLVGDLYVIEHYRTLLNIATPLADYRHAQPGAEIAVCDVQALPRAEFAPGRICAAAGAATIAYVKQCVEMAQSGSCAA